MKVRNAGKRAKPNRLLVKGSYAMSVKGISRQMVLQARAVSPAFAMMDL